MRFPQTGPPPLDEELDELLLDELLAVLLDELLAVLLDELLLAVLLEDDEAAVLLEEALELDEASPLLLEEVGPLPPEPLEVCPDAFVPEEVITTPPAPPLFSSGPSERSPMTPVQAPSAREIAESAQSVCCFMTNDTTRSGFLVSTAKSELAEKNVCGVSAELKTVRCCQMVYAAAR